MTDRNDSKPKLPKSAAQSRPRAFAEGKLGSSDGDARAPVTREEVMRDLRKVLKDIASHILVAGPDSDSAEAILGFEIQEKTFQDVLQIDPEMIQLERFSITAIIDKAYDFAYQVGPRSNRYTIEDGEVQRILTIRHDSPGGVWGLDQGSISDSGDHPICRTIDTAHARWEYAYRGALTVRQLALLANMTEPAVRTSLSKEGIRTAGGRDKDSGLTKISIEDSRRWLEGRRGFVPTLIPEPIDSFYTDDIVNLFKAHGFEAGLENPNWGRSLYTTAQEAEIDPDWLLEVATGRPAKLDIDALNRLSEYLFADSPAFVGGLVERILRANEGAK